MPELNVIHIAIITVMTVVGVFLGWMLRSRRSKEEKVAVSALWQEQIDAQRTEHDRLTDQNKGLMEQINQYQASNKDAKNRAKELSEAVQEAYSRRDQLQREIKDIRGNLEVAMTERDQLRSDIDANDDAETVLQAKDSRIKKLQAELVNWQNRVPPLIEKFRQRNEDAQRLESELEIARDRIVELQTASDPEQTRIEPVNDPGALTDGRDASNDATDESPDDEPLAGPEFDSEPESEQESEWEPEPEPEPEAESESESESEWEPEPEPEPEAESESEWEPESELQDETQDETGSDDDGSDDNDESGELDKVADSEAPVDGPINGRDSLQAIKGIGPAIEKTLNEMGIFSFQQIAEMSEYDIDRVAKRLKGFRSRIYREDWIGQARELQDQVASD